MQHLDEGIIHAWLDGELQADEADKAAAHVSECSECRALVAEARGLIAASTRILTALDNVPAGVVPSGSSQSDEAAAVGGPTRRRWYDRTDLRAAAALLFVAGASLVAARLGRNPNASLQTVARMERSPSAMPVQDTGTPAPAAAEATQRDRVSEIGAVVGGASSTAGRGAPRAATPAPTKAAAQAPMAATMNAATNPPAMEAQSLQKSAESRASPSRGFMSGVSRSDAAAPGRVEGQITDWNQGHGIASAQVTIEGTTLVATTDKDGRFRIDSVPAGEQRLTVRRVGYVAQTVPLAVKEQGGANAIVALVPMLNQLSEAVVSGVATATYAAAAPLRVLKVDSTATTRRVVYEVSPGVEVTLTESAVDVAADEKALDSSVARNPSGMLQGAAKADTRPALGVMSAAATKRPPIHTISWRDLNRRYTLSGPMTPSELEAIKARLMTARR